MPSGRAAARPAAAARAAAGAASAAVAAGRGPGAILRDPGRRGVRVQHDLRAFRGGQRPGLRGARRVSATIHPPIPASVFPASTPPVARSHAFFFKLAVRACSYDDPYCVDYGSGVGICMTGRKSDQCATSKHDPAFCARKE